MNSLKPVDWIILFVIGLMVACGAFYSNNAQAADVNLVIRIIECESSGKYNAVGDDGVSIGIAQFQEVTFNEMKHLAHMDRLRWKNPIHQLKLMVWMLDHGYGNRWTCYRKIMGQPVMDSIGRTR